MNAISHFYLANQEYSTIFDELKNSIDTTTSKTYIIDFRSDFQNSKIIRDFVGEIFDTFNIIHPWRGRFVLIADELVNNSIEHGSWENEINQCIIGAGYCDENKKNFHISFEVHDTWKKWKHTQDEMWQVKENRTQNAEDSVYMEKRGRGLFHITEKIVDRLSFSQSEKWWLAVRVEKNIPVSENCQKKESV